MERKNCSLTLFHYNLHSVKVVRIKGKGPSINYVSMFEGGGGHKMLMDAYVGEGQI